MRHRASWVGVSRRSLSRSGSSRGTLSRGSVGKRACPTFLSLCSLKVGSQVTVATNLCSEPFEVDILPHYLCKQSKQRVKDAKTKITPITKLSIPRNKALGSSTKGRKMSFLVFRGRGSYLIVSTTSLSTRVSWYSALGTNLVGLCQYNKDRGEKSD